MALHLDNLIKDRLGGGAAFACIKTTFADVAGKRLLAVECVPSDRTVFLKSPAGEEFYIRAVASSPALSASQTHEHVQQHFK